MIIKFKKEKYDVIPYRSFLSHLRGFMFNFTKKDGLLFIFKKETYVTLHTFFVFNKLDIIYLDKNKNITKIRNRILPFTLFIPPEKCKYVIELKKETKVKVGDKIKL